MASTYSASIGDAWALWTSKPAIESWWGPEGFEVTVLTFDLRPGGELVYLMTARVAEQVAYMKAAGLPLSNFGWDVPSPPNPPSLI